MNGTICAPRCRLTLTCNADSQLLFLRISAFILLSQLFKAFNPFFPFYAFSVSLLAFPVFLSAIRAKRLPPNCIRLMAFDANTVFFVPVIVFHASHL
jgi:hypothetical protein